MSGASVTLKGLSEAQDLLRGLIAKGENLTPLMRNIQTYGVKSTKKRIRDEKRSPDGQPWPVYKNTKYAARKAKLKNAGLLVYSGMLLKSISGESTRDTAQWGSNKEYAAIHQFGGKHIAARPFLGLSDDNEEDIPDMMKKYVAGKA